MVGMAKHSIEAGSGNRPRLHTFCGELSTTIPHRKPYSRKSQNTPYLGFSASGDPGATAMVVPPTEMIPVLIDTAETLKGSQRRAFIAKTVQAMGRGGQRWAEAHLGWCRGTIRKAMHELHSGMTCLDAFSARRRQRAEGHLPRLLDDIKDIVDGQSQTDPKFQTDRLFTRISAAEVRKQ